MDIIIYDDGLIDDLEQWLTAEGYCCRHITDSQALQVELIQRLPDVIIQTCVQPESSTYAALDWIADNPHPGVPIILIGTKNDEQCIVEALHRGADDYLAIPLRRLELIARLEALIRRVRRWGTALTHRHYGPYTIDESARAILNDGVRVTMTHKEYELARFLFNNIGNLVSRQSILEQVWGHTSQINTRTVDTHVSRIRKKLQLTPECGWNLCAIYQNGYRLEQCHPHSRRFSE